MEELLHNLAASKSIQKMNALSGSMAATLVKSSILKCQQCIAPKENATTMIWSKTHIAEFLEKQEHHLVKHGIPQ